MATRRTRKSSGAKGTAKRGAKASTRPGRKTGKNAASKSSWGGRRAGAGRPVGSGTGPSPDSRRNRIAVMLSDKELQALKSLAKAKNLPLATAVYDMVKPKLRRRS